MRLIKFRAWDGKKMKDSCFKVHSDGHLECLPNIDCLGFEPVLMQFTGLTDANGVDIYEGDIVRWDDASKGKLWRVAQVVWHENGTWAYRIIPSSCVGCFKDGKGHDFKLGNFIYTPDSTAYGNILEVIGNIHQNPELLESNNV